MSYKTIENGSITTPIGFLAQGVHAGIKKEKLDLGVIYSTVPASAAGVYTTNLVKAAPLVVSQETIKGGGKLQAIVANSGNANACTGDQGLADARAMQDELAQGLGIDASLVAVASTGVIGVPMPMPIVLAGIELALEDLSIEGGGNFGQAILTTDTVAKEVAVQLEIDGKTVVIGGAAKGSGMIHPNMATMLGFITTDAQIEPAFLQELLSQVTEDSFNMITVDGDTSTNDTVMVMANGQAGVKLDKSHSDWAKYEAAFAYVAQYLAIAIARDGEGATKLVETTVRNARSRDQAAIIAKSIIGSSLVKTAIYGNDPNWGRILAAAGYAGVDFDPNQVSAYLMGTLIYDQGLGADYDEESLKKAMQEAERVTIEVDMGQGNAEATAWGCDLTYDYVKINASYRT